MQKFILKGILKPHQREAGYYLEDDEDFVYIMWQGEEQARCSSKIPVEVLWDAVDKLMEVKNGIY